MDVLRVIDKTDQVPCKNGAAKSSDRAQMKRESGARRLLRAVVHLPKLSVAGPTKGQARAERHERVTNLQGTKRHLERPLCRRMAPLEKPRQDERIRRSKRPSATQTNSSFRGGLLGTALEIRTLCKRSSWGPNHPEALSRNGSRRQARLPALNRYSALAPAPVGAGRTMRISHDDYSGR